MHSLQTYNESENHPIIQPKIMQRIYPKRKKRDSLVTP